MIGDYKFKEKDLGGPTGATIAAIFFSDLVNNSLDVQTSAVLICGAMCFDVFPYCSERLLRQAYGYLKDTNEKMKSDYHDA